MKILICTINFSPERTATGKYTGELAEWLAANGHDVQVIAAPPHYPEWKVFEGYRGFRFFTQYDRGMLVRRVPCYVPGADKVTGFTRILMELSFTLLSLVYWVPILFRRSKFDLVIAICPPMQTALLPWIYKMTRGVPYLFHIQDFQVDMALQLGILRSNPLTRLLYRVEAFLLQSASLVSTITPRMKQRAVEKGVESSRVSLLPNWANLRSIVPGDRNNPLRSDLGIDDSAFVVLYSGGMGEKQGLEVLLECARITAGDKDIIYLIAGEGGAKARLLAKASELSLSNVRFLPIQPIERLSDLLAISDVCLVVQRESAADFVMPSKVTNILSAGRPVIATAGEDTELGKLIQENKLGRIVPSGSAEDMARAIEELRASPSETERMGSDAREYAERNLDINAILSHFENTIHEFCKLAGPDDR